MTHEGGGEWDARDGVMLSVTSTVYSVWTKRRPSRSVRSSCVAVARRVMCAFAFAGVGVGVGLTPAASTMWSITSERGVERCGVVRCDGSSDAWR